MTAVYDYPNVPTRLQNVADLSQARVNVMPLQSLSASVASYGLPHHSLTVVTERRKRLETTATAFAPAKAPPPPYGHFSSVSYLPPPMSSSQPPLKLPNFTSAAPEARSISATDQHNVPATVHGSRPEAAAAARPEPTATSGNLATSGVHQSLLYSSAPRLPSLGQGTLLGRNYYPQRAAIPASSLSAGARVSAIGRATGPLKSIKSSRRGKTHVQKACVNCKRAHLSCDAQRPCARCVGSGKQDTCHDVEHKKRGRPRLRDDREVRAGRDLAPTEQPAASVQPRSTYSAVTSPAHRRAQSGRILRSHRPSVGHSSRPVAAQRHTIGAGPTSSSRAPAARVFMNMNFRILRANSAFQEQFASGAEVRGRSLQEFVEPRHEQDLQRLGTDLRSEREQRDPMALPTIFSDQEQQAIDSIDENNIDAYVAGSRERQESWYFVGSQGSMQRTLVVQLGHVGTFAFILFTMPYSIPITLPPLPTAYAASMYQQQHAGQAGPAPLWDPGYMRSPGSGPVYPQTASGSTTPSLSLQSLAATLPPTSLTVSVPASGLSRYPSSSSEYFPSQPMRHPSSQQSPVSQYPPGQYQSASSSGGTRPQSTISEPLSATSGPPSLRRPLTYSGQPTPYEAEPEPPLPSLATALGALGAPQDESVGDDGRKRRRLDINDITD